MIREGRKLPPNAADRIPAMIDRISRDSEVVAVLAFGSLAAGELKPLSDLDFGVLVSKQIDKEKRFDKHLELIGLFTEIFQTEEVDLVLLNDAPMRFSHKIIASGELLYCADRSELTDFIEKTVKGHLDFKFFRDEFDNSFLTGIGYHG
jgi:predicted nucleotidyltransferase